MEQCGAEHPVRTTRLCETLGLIDMVEYLVVMSWGKVSSDDGDDECLSIKVNEVAEHKDGYYFANSVTYLEKYFWYIFLHFQC